MYLQSTDPCDGPARAGKFVRWASRSSVHVVQGYIHGRRCDREAVSQEYTRNSASADCDAGWQVVMMTVGCDGDSWSWGFGARAIDWCLRPKLGSNYSSLVATYLLLPYWLVTASQNLRRYILANLHVFQALFIYSLHLASSLVAGAPFHIPDHGSWIV
jgi:hypothetical protein